MLDDGSCRICVEQVDAPETALLSKGEERQGSSKRLYVLQGGCLVLIAFVTAHALWFLHGTSKKPGYNILEEPEWQAIQMVWSTGWIAAMASVFGMLPFLFVSTLNEKVVASSNAVAAGVMIATSIGLAAEGVFDKESQTDQTSPFSSCVAVIVGCYLGIGFIKLSEYVLGDVGTGDKVSVDVRDVRRVLVVMTAMTVHAFSEGCGIGVSFHSNNLGSLVALTLAVHNVPEGLAVSILLVPRGYSKVSTFLWCVFSSFPQPLMAVPAFLFVRQFSCVAPIGYGFAAGAMGHVAIYELLEEAQESLSHVKSYAITAIAMLCMCLIQIFARQELMYDE